MTADTTPGPLLHPASAVCPEFLFLPPKNAQRGRSTRSRTSCLSPQRHASAGSTKALEDHGIGAFET